jgi:hypothetical protein
MLKPSIMSSRLSKTCKPSHPVADDIKALLALLQYEDKSRITHALQTVGCLTSSVEEDSPTKILCVIVCQDKTFTCFSELYHRFREHGFVDVAAKFLGYYEIKSGKSRTSPFVCRSNADIRMRALDNFRRWQGMLHDGLYKDPFHSINVLLTQQELKWRNESNEERKLHYADNCGYLQILNLDTAMSMYDPSQFNEELFQRLHSFSTQTSSSPTFDAWCCARRSLALAYAGNVTAAEDIARHAMFLAQFGSANLEYANVLYFSICYKLCCFQHSQTTELKESLLRDGEEALRILVSDIDPFNESNLVTRRVVLLRMASCLVGIGLKGNVFPNYQVSTGDLQKAESILAAIDWSGAVDRRKMFRYRILTRIAELRGNLCKALRNISKAYSIAQRNHFKEVGVIYSCLYSLLKSLNNTDTSTTRRHSF